MSEEIRNDQKRQLVKMQSELNAQVKENLKTKKKLKKITDRLSKESH